jgi:hypothetical protein
LSARQVQQRARGRNGNGSGGHDVRDNRAAGKRLDFERLHTAVAGLRGKQIFFVGGLLKSGTTWLQLLLNAHPQRV